MLGGCVQDQDFLIVERATWFNGRDNCALSNGGDTPLAMAVDVAYDTQIGMAFIVANNQSPNANSNTGIDDSEIQIESAEVNLSFSGGAIEGGSFEAAVPTDSIKGGDSAVFLVRIPTQVTQSLRSAMSGLPEGSIETLEMDVVFKGRKTGQAGNTKLGEVETRPYTYPFDICLDCLTDCDECGTCPTQTEWVGSCGFAQGVSIYHPVCDSDETP